MTTFAPQEDLDLSAKAIYGTLFELDILVPRLKVTGDALPPHARVFRMTLDGALRDMTQRENVKAREDAIEWVRDHDGWCSQRIRGFTYPISFDEAVACGYVGLNPDILRHELLKRISNGTLTRSDVMQYRIASGAHQAQRMAQ